MIKLDITLWIQIVEALILTFILHYILTKPVMSYMEKRQEHFKALEKEIDDLVKSVEDSIKRYESEIAKAREEGIKKREMLKEEARKFEKDLLAKVMKEVEEYKNKWAQEFARQLEEVRKQLQANIEMFANLIVERVLGRKV